MYDVGIFIGSFGLFFTLILLFVRVLPVISLAEIKAVVSRGTAGHDINRECIHMEKPLYSLTALFSTPDALMHAVEATVKAGYTKYDVHSPYPVHGMERAMRLKPSPLGYFALAFGLLGAVTAVGFMTWVTLVDYPLVIGGKPFWSWPAFVPVAFEITVLLASVLTVVAMIVLYFKFPNNSHPLHDTPYMKRVSSDGFGISIQREDPLFDEAAVRQFLASVRRHGDRSGLFRGGSLRPRTEAVRSPVCRRLLAGVAIVVAGTTYFSLNSAAVHGSRSPG